MIFSDRKRKLPEKWPLKTKDRSPGGPAVAVQPSQDTELANSNSPVIDQRGPWIGVEAARVTIIPPRVQASHGKGQGILIQVSMAYCHLVRHVGCRRRHRLHSLFQVA